MILKGPVRAHERPESPEPWQEPIVVNRPAKHWGSALRIVVFNARGGIRFDGILACLRRPPLADAGVILLCEADWSLRRSGRREIAAELAAALKMSFAYVPEFHLSGTDAMTSLWGNALLCAEPLEDVKTIPLPHNLLRRRMAGYVRMPVGLIAGASFGGRRITLGLVRLDGRWHPFGREWQMAEFLAAFPAEGPAIIGGDFNTTTMDLTAGALRGSLAFRDPQAAVRLIGKLVFRPRRFRAPELYEPLFERLRDSGFTVRGVNVENRPTFTYSRLIPPWMRPKLDWIAVRGVASVPGTAAVIPARRSPFGARVSDHDFVICDFRI
jgi:endonuclease/exonuclease/phosphatase family metal-dependent hydrolase